jgi:uncharacterized Fe-S center protein
LDDLATLYDKVLSKVVKKNDLVALKMHFGEYGNTGFIRSVFIRKIVEKILACEGKPFVTDSNTLYTGMRHNAIDHHINAVKNGFTFSTIGAPIIIADGLHGHASRDVEINQKHFKTVKIAESIAEADSMIAASHFKGHMASGFGGAIKNLAMGCASRAGKQQQHSGSKPKIRSDKCIKCQKCGKICPENAFNYKKGFAEIDYKKCVGCDECVTVCQTKAIDIDWGDGNAQAFQERMVEYAFGAVKGKQVGYINFLMDISPDCDCFGRSDAPIVPNIGLLASLDPIAIDQASLDLVNNAMGLENSRLKDIKSNDKFKCVHGVTSIYQLEYGEKIGLGKREYKLIKI